MDASEKVIACSLSGTEFAKRAERSNELGGYEVEPLENGLRLVFANDVGDERQELVELERECCAFADWTTRDNVVEITATTADAVAAVKALGF
jgi:hypothetical protein